MGKSAIRCTAFSVRKHSQLPVALRINRRNGMNPVLRLKAVAKKNREKALDKRSVGNGERGGLKSTVTSIPGQQ